MKSIRFLAAVLVAAIILSHFPTGVFAQGPVSAKVEVALQRSLDNGGKADVIVYLEDRYGVGQALQKDDPQAAARRAEANWWDVSAGLGKVQGRCEMLWIINACVIRGADKALVKSLEKAAGIARIQGKTTVQLADENSSLGSGPLPVKGWNLRQIGAPSVWDMGITGVGVLVFNIDTGVDVTHPDLREGFAGEGAWADFTKNPKKEPYDDYGHGTHTMSTAVGRNGIGVAPGAKWGACKGLDKNGYGEDVWILQCFQWILTLPEGQRPQVVSNSWGGDASSCSDGKCEIFRPAVDVLRAAGIPVVFSNGNEGPGAGTAGYPAYYPGVISVSATNYQDSVSIFSSCGPGPYKGVPNPILSAPGSIVYSAVPGGYDYFSGTSMAAPHVAGAIALMHEVYDGLTVTETVRILTETAYRPPAMTLSGHDNCYGWGRLDALAAVKRVSSEYAFYSLDISFSSASGISGGFGWNGSLNPFDEGGK